MYVLINRYLYIFTLISLFITNVLIDRCMASASYSLYGYGVSVVL